MTVVPMTIKAANATVAKWHRHNKPTQGGRFAIGAMNRDKLVAVAIVGRTTARMLHDDTTAEVTRLCAIDGAPDNSCSFLYGACRRIWQMMGGKRLVTYTLKTESGASLRGAGWNQFTGSDYTLMVADGRMSDMPAGYPPLATLEEAEAKADAVRAMLDEQSQRKKPSKTNSRKYAT